MTENIVQVCPEHGVGHCILEPKTGLYYCTCGRKCFAGKSTQQQGRGLFGFFGGKRHSKHFKDVCRRCGKGITTKNKSLYSFLCKKCLSTINRKLFIGGKHKRVLSSKEMLQWVKEHSCE